MGVLRKSHTVGFPVYSLSFEPRYGVNHLIVGGGGGASKAGVPNAVVRYSVQGYDDLSKTLRNSVTSVSKDPDFPDRDPLSLPPLSLVKIAEHTFRKDEDACMSLCVHPKERTVICGVNENDELVQSGKNNNCRILFIMKNNFTTDVSFNTMDAHDSFHHQKVCKFNKNGLILVTGTSNNKLSFWTWPQCQPYLPSLNLGGEVLDVDFDETNSKLVAVTPSNLWIIDPRTGSTVFKIGNVHIGGTEYSFRSARFGRRKPLWESGYYGDNCKPSEFYDHEDYDDSFVNLKEDSHVGTSQFLYVVLNSKSRKSGILCKWFLPGNLRSVSVVGDSGSQIHKPESDYESITRNWKLIRKVRFDSVCSAMAISTNGKYIALALSKNYSINVYSTRNNLRKLYDIPSAHGFAITSLSFSPNDRVLVSGSADGTCLVTEVLRKHNSGSIGSVLLILLLLLLAIGCALYFLPEEFDKFAAEFMREEL